MLPVNDTSVNGTWWDSYPYSSLSVFALHPQVWRKCGECVWWVVCFKLCRIAPFFSPPYSPSTPPPTHTVPSSLPSAQYLSLRALRDEMPVEIGTEVRGGQGEGGGGVAVEGEGGMTQALGRARGW